jgi:hypothetical protein
MRGARQTTWKAPLRRVVSIDGDRAELECGHGKTFDPDRDPIPPKRMRCPTCPIEPPKLSPKDEREALVTERKGAA